MPGPIGIGKKVVRTYVARKRNQAILKGGEQQSGRSLTDNVQDYRQAKSLTSKAATSQVEHSYEVVSYESSYYSDAIEMCSNAGQVAIIESMGAGAFGEAATAHNEGGDAAGELEALCPYPEVVGEILEEIGSQIADEVESQWGEGDWDGDEDGGDGEWNI